MRDPWLDLPIEGDERLYKTAVSYLKGMAMTGHTVITGTVAATLRRGYARTYAFQSDRHNAAFEKCWHEITGEAYPWQSGDDVRLKGPWDDLPDKIYDKAAAVLYLKRRHLGLSIRSTLAWHGSSTDTVQAAPRTERPSRSCIVRSPAKTGPSGLEGNASLVIAIAGAFAADRGSVKI